MALKKFIINRDYVSIDDEITLTNYWAKYVLHIIERIISEQEHKICRQIGEQEFESFYDRIDEYSGMINRVDFQINAIPEEFIKLGIAIVKGSMTGAEFAWNIRGYECKIDGNIVPALTDTYFKQIIMPFCKLAADDEILVEGDFTELVILFELQFSRAGYKLARTEKISTEIEHIEFIKNDNTVVAWNENNSFLIKCDMVDCIPIDVSITSTDKAVVQKAICVYFPFFRKGNTVSISFYQEDNEWFIEANNLEYQITYNCEIKV